MNPPKFEACVTEVKGYLQHQEEVETALLFGSAALGTSTEESDLDLFLVAPRRAHDQLARDLFRIGARHDVTVSPYLVERSEVEDQDEAFLQALARDGVVLKGRPLDLTLHQLALEPHHLVKLRLEGLPQKGKVGLSRALYGYRSSRNYRGRKYTSRKRGFVEEVGGVRLGRGTVLIPSKAWPAMEGLLHAHGAKRWGFTVWVQATS